MSPVGHSLMGLAIGRAVVPREFSPRAKAATLAAYVLLASAPDLPLPMWGHTRYDISHSVIVNTAAILAAAAAAALVLRRTRYAYAAKRLILGGVAAWYSHFLLDTFYTRRKGLMMFWPVSDARVSLAMPWISHMDLDPLVSVHNLRIFAIEGLFYGVILLAVIVIRRALDRRVDLGF